MTRRRWIYPNDGSDCYEVTADYVPEPKGPLVIGEIPSYQSPVDGKWVDGRVQRREDLKRTGSRPWEGMDQERKESARQRAYNDQKLDRQLDKTLHQSWMQLSDSSRRALQDF